MQGFQIKSEEEEGARADLDSRRPRRHTRRAMLVMVISSLGSSHLKVRCAKLAELDACRASGARLLHK